MSIAIQRQGNEVLVTLKGRLDTATTPRIGEALKEPLEKAEACTLELGDLEYISSAGLRLLLVLHKQMTAAGGRLLLRSVRPGVMDILEMTGFSDILAIE